MQIPFADAVLGRRERRLLLHAAQWVRGQLLGQAHFRRDDRVRGTRLQPIDEWAVPETVLNALLPRHKRASRE
jgi:hypothetical protein